ncbi:MAG TPA: Hpt domain-containing protein [Phycisphaerales bacterium]
MAEPTSPMPLRSTLASDPDMVELVQEFVQELPNRAATLESLLTASSFSDLRRLAHQLKGAAGGYGFSPISESAAKVETTLREDVSGEQVQVLRSQVEELVGLCRRATAG